MPKVSIGMPVYNGEPYIEAAVSSVLAQTVEDLELLISDNASTDNTQEICQEFAASDSRVRYLRSEENRGAAFNYNYAFHCASAPYFKWAAHDDLCLPTFLESCLEVLESDQSIAVCYPRTQVIDEGGDVSRSYSDGLHIDDEDPRARLRRYMRINFLRRTGMCNPIFGVIRSRLLAQTSLIQGFVASDRSLLAQLAILGRFHELDDELFQRRIHLANSTLSNRSVASRQAWFTPGARVSLLSHLSNNHFRVRYRQVADIYMSTASFDLPRALRRQCQLELLLQLALDPKWIYIDLNKTLMPRRAEAVLHDAVSD